MASEKASLMVTESDEDEEQCGSDDAKFCRKRGASVTSRRAHDRISGCLMGCCACCLATLLAMILAAVLGVSNAESWLTAASQKVLTATLGVPVSLDSISLSLFQGRASVVQLDVSSPPGFQSDFLGFQSLIFDLNLPSVLESRLLGSSTIPLEVEEFAITSLNVFIEEKSDGSSNVKEILDHITKIDPESSASFSEDSIGDDLHTLTTRVKADRIEFRNISIAVCIHPVCDNTPPITYTLKEILVTDIGKRGKGVFLYQLAEVFVRTLLMAVVKAAPENLRQNVVRAVGAGVASAMKKLDYGTVHFNAGDGLGLQDVGEFSGWIAGQAAALPLKASNSAAAMNLQALKAQTAITNAAVSTEAKASLEATKVGTAFTGMGVQANTAFTNMGVKANSAVLSAETKANIAANNALTKLRTGFTSGFSGGLLR